VSIVVQEAAGGNSRRNNPRPSIFAGSYYRNFDALEPSPIVTDWIIDGAPEATAKYLMETRDGTSFTVVWDCTAGSFRWRYGEDETVYIVSGEVFITDDGGEERRLAEGDMAFFPAGSSAVWRIPERVRKLAVLNRVSFPKPLVSILRTLKSLRPKLSAVATALGVKELILKVRRRRQALVA
jgi:uncharacterized protein